MVRRCGCSGYCSCELSRFRRSSLSVLIFGAVAPWYIVRDSKVPRLNINVEPDVLSPACANVDGHSIDPTIKPMAFQLVWRGTKKLPLKLDAPPLNTLRRGVQSAIGKAVIDQGYRVIYREADILLEEIAEATLNGNRKEHMELLSTVPLLIID
jgi:hypothetical protein